MLELKKKKKKNFAMSVTFVYDCTAATGTEEGAVVEFLKGRNENTVGPSHLSSIHSLMHSFIQLSAQSMLLLLLLLLRRVKGKP